MSQLKNFQSSRRVLNRTPQVKKELPYVPCMKEKWFYLDDSQRISPYEAREAIDNFLKKWYSISQHAQPHFWNAVYELAINPRADVRELVDEDKPYCINSFTGGPNRHYSFYSPYAGQTKKFRNNPNLKSNDPFMVVCFPKLTSVYDLANYFAYLSTNVELYSHLNKIAGKNILIDR